jgi:PncC family amidohydrolase
MPKPDLENRIVVIKNRAIQPSVNDCAKKLGMLLLEKKLSLAVAESCTGGLLGGALTAVAGSSAYFKGGVIAYGNDAKRRILGVPEDILDKKGAVSAEAVKAMAIGARRLCAAECAISISGIAGPGGGTKGKPVGCVFVGISAGRSVKSYKYLFRGNRQSIRQQAVKAALQKMIKRL